MIFRSLELNAWQWRMIIGSHASQSFDLSMRRLTSSTTIAASCIDLYRTTFSSARVESVSDLVMGLAVVQAPPNLLPDQSDTEHRSNLGVVYQLISIKELSHA